MEDPLIITLRFDDESEARFQSARDRWFPPRLNIVPAHLTLFHQLPGEKTDTLTRIATETAAATPRFAAHVSAVISLGAGWAYRVRSEHLDALHAHLAKAFAPWLTRQDAKGFRAHVTIQNKVGQASANACGTAIHAQFMPWEASVTGLRLWAYRDGPWEALDTLPLA